MIRHPQLQRAMPVDFIEVAKSMGRRKLMEHYKTGAATVDRWLGEMYIKQSKEEKHAR